MKPKLNRPVGIWKDERGSTGPLFGLLLVPMIGLMALAVDYSRALKVQERMQTLLDGAVIAAMRDRSSSASEKEMIATAYFNGNFKENASLVAPAKPAFSFNEDGTYSATVNAKVKTPFGRFVAVPFMNAAGKTKVAAPQGSGQKVEIAMMIDLTGSMGSTRNGQSKIDGLKLASQDLLNILYPEGDNENVRVGVVPMADYVNVGDIASEVTGLPETGSYARSEDLTSTRQGRFSGAYSGVHGSNQPAGSQFGATSQSSGGGTFDNGHCTGDGAFATYNGWPIGTPGNRNSPDARRGAYYQRLNNNWLVWHHNGNAWYIPERSSTCSESANQTGQLITCVTERKDTTTRYTDDAPAAGRYIGPYNQSWSGVTNKLNYSADGKCYVAGRELPKVVPLTSSKSALETFFEDATIGGATPGHLGHAWAWYMLSPKWSSIWPTGSEPAEYEDTGTRKIAIIMTDGEYNTQYANDTSRNQALALCQGMKDQDITVYTIGFGFSTSANPGDGSAEGNTKQMLAQCSSGDNHFYFPYDSNALRQVFEHIGDGIMGESAVTSELKIVE